MKTPRQLTVALDATDSAVAALHRAVLASLPQRFLVTGKRVGECADIVVVSAQEPFWLDRIRPRSRCRDKRNSVGKPDRG